MSSAAWRSLIHHGDLRRILETFGIHIVELILEERHRGEISDVARNPD